MKAIILAAGQGTRLKKYTENLPKGMLDFAGSTLIERQIEMYHKCGIDNVIIVKGFAAEKINYSGVKYYLNKEFANTNMVESLMTAKEEFNDDVVVSYSDVLFSENLLKGMINASADFCVSVDDDWKNYWKARYGKVDFDTESLSIDDEDNIIELGLESPNIEKIDARYIGVLKFSKAGLKKVLKIMEKAYTLPENQPWQQSGKVVKKAYMTDLLQAIISTGEKVKAVHFKNGWLEFDTNDDYEIAMEWYKKGTIKKFILLH